MNTDNMSILGLTIDYGPFGFIDGFNADHICNHSDENGNYAYRRQPPIGEWNCAALGEALTPLIGSDDEAHAALVHYRSAFELEFKVRMRAKLGLRSEGKEDERLFNQLLEMLHAGRVDFTLFFFVICRGCAALMRQPTRRCAIFFLIAAPSTTGRRCIANDCGRKALRTPNARRQ